MLTVKDLSIIHERSGDPVVLTGPISFNVGKGEIFGLVGESGSGKSITALALMRLVPEMMRIEGSAELDGKDLLSLTRRQMQSVRGADISMVFQEPMAALNPVFTLRQQLVAAIRAHQNVSRKAAQARGVELLKMVGIPDPERRIDSYPHQLSGGMCQRAMIAIALASGAKFLIADEPTTSLDVTIQEQIIRLIEGLVVEKGLSVLFISHDLGVVSRLCNKVAVLYAGQVVETGDARALLGGPLHPYAQGLLRCAPDLGEIGTVQRGIPGAPPPAMAWPPGCRFADRCEYVQDRCRAVQQLRDFGDGRQARCCRVEEISELKSMESRA